MYKSHYLPHSIIIILINTAVPLCKYFMDIVLNVLILHYQNCIVIHITFNSLMYFSFEL